MSHRQEIVTEQLRTLHRYLPSLLVIHLLVGAGLLAIVHESIPAALSFGWGVALLVVVVGRLLDHIVYRRGVGAASRAGALRRFVAGSGAGGLLWGATALVLLASDSAEHKLFVLFLLSGMCAGAVSSLTIHLPAFLAFTWPALLPPGLALLTGGDTLHVVLGLLTLVYLGALNVFGHNIWRSHMQSLRLRFENLDLVAALQQQAEAAEQANAAKSRFLAAASHDLRQPLHALSLFTSALDESIRYPRVRRIVDQIKHSVESLQGLFDGLLDISRLDAGTLEPERQDFRLRELIERLSEEYSMHAAEKGLRFAAEPCDYRVNSDPTLLQQLLRNLLANAVRYTEHGEIRLHCRPGPEGLELAVTDTGIGIPPEQHKAVFSEFCQLGNPERDRSKGLGLGLAIVERIARLLDHPVRLESQPGVGSTFTVLIRDARVVRHPPIEALPQAGAAAGPTPGVVAVIDDDAAAREAMETLLSQWGCEVVSAVDAAGVEAALAARALDLGVIIADYRLAGGETGVDAIAALRARHGPMPALVVTGDIGADSLQRLSMSGLNVLHKPVPTARLRAFLRAASRRVAAEGDLSAG